MLKAPPNNHQLPEAPTVPSPHIDWDFEPQSPQSQIMTLHNHQLWIFLNCHSPFQTIQVLWPCPSTFCHPSSQLNSQKMLTRSKITIIPDTNFHSVTMTISITSSTKETPTVKESLSKEHRIAAMFFTLMTLAGYSTLVPYEYTYLSMGF